MLAFGDQGVQTSLYTAEGGSMYQRAFRGRMYGEGYDRFIAYVTGVMTWGTGSSAPDVSLSRSDENTLTLGYGDHLHLDGTYNGGMLILGSYRI